MKGSSPVVVIGFDRRSVGSDNGRRRHVLVGWCRSFGLLAAPDTNGTIR
jgi:hypothetical protein